MTASPESPRVDRGEVIWTPKYLGYRWSKSHPMNPGRLALTMDLATDLGLLAEVEPLAPDAATDDDLLRVHTAAYVDAVRRAGEAAADEAGGLDSAIPTEAYLAGDTDAATAVHGSFGHGLGTVDNPIFPHMHEASAILAGGTLAAARAIADGRTRKAVSIGGGMHHAMPDAASGFCVYNDAGVAIAWLLEHGYDRIAYIDIDAHHGDGVQKMFWDDPRVLTFSIHQHPATLWPNIGWVSEVGDGPAEGTAVNLPVLPDTVDEVWLRALHAVVPGALSAFRPQIIVSQAGVDSHREDPLADLSLTVDGQRAAFQAMRGWADTYAEGRWLAVGGGGYGVLRVVPRSWTHLLAVTLGVDLDPSTRVPDSWLERTAQISGDVELPTTMSDGGRTDFVPWGGPGATAETGDPVLDRALTRVDSAILATRRSVYPLLGLDPEDPRD